MNIYEVISEELWYIEPILDDGAGPKIPYKIFEYVAAKSRSQAKWIIWKNQKNFDATVISMPKFYIRLVTKNVLLPAGRINDAFFTNTNWGTEPIIIIWHIKT